MNDFMAQGYGHQQEAAVAGAHGVEVDEHDEVAAVDLA
jgi:hypothetical protein